MAAKKSAPPSNVGARLDTHEAVCAERYKVVEASLAAFQNSIRNLYNRQTAALVALIMVLVSCTGGLVVGLAILFSKSH